MFGAIIGDIVGSRFEGNNYQSKSFDLFGNDDLPRPPCKFTDDTVMTAAVADALLQFDSIGDGEAFQAVLTERMHAIGRAHPNCGVGVRFCHWIMRGGTRPYGSYGNGSAMRVSPVGWYADSLAEAERIAELSAAVTHNHPEGIKGAKAVAGVIWLARHGAGKPELREYVTERFYPDAFSRSLAEIRPGFTFDVSCQGTVPAALEAFWEAADFEDAVRNAVSLGGDSDTLAAITGSIAEAYYGVPDPIREKAVSFLDAELREITLRFTEKYGK